MHEPAMFTAKADLVGRRRGFRYIPAHELLEQAGASHAIAQRSRRLVPDQLFEIDFVGLIRAFMAEADQRSEPVACANAGKSRKSALSMHSQTFATGLPNRYCRLKAAVQGVWMLSTPARIFALRQLLAVAQNGSPKRFIALFDDSDPQQSDLWI